MLFTDERYDGIDKVNLTTAFEIVSDSKPVALATVAIVLYSILKRLRQERKKD